MKHLITTIGSLVVALAIAACTNAPAVSSGSAAASVQPASPDASAEESEDASTPEPTAEEDDDGDDDDTGGGGGGGPTGPVFGGSIEQAIPPVVAGEPVGVIGPVSAENAAEELGTEGLSADQLAMIDALGLAEADVELAVGFSDSVIISATRFIGASSEEIDRIFLEIYEAASGTSNFRVETVAGRNVHAYESLLPSNYAWVNGDILFVVAATEEGGPQAVAAMPPPTVSLVASDGGGDIPRTEVQLTLTGGDDAGDYEAATDEGGCSRNPFGADEGLEGFGLQYSVSEASVVFSSLQLVVDDAEAAREGGTDQFYALVTVNDNDHSLDPADGDGTGEVVLEDSGGDEATIQITGTTADDVEIDATVQCNFILDFGG